MIKLISAIQGLRLNLENSYTGLGGATGIRVQLYPHQLWAVSRILEAPRISHLLLAEVGTGKTIMAMMVVNALWRQNPNLRVKVLVPGAIKNQWYMEWAKRMHHIPHLDPHYIESELNALENITDGSALFRRFDLVNYLQAGQVNDFEIAPMDKLQILSHHDVNNAEDLHCDFLIVDEPQQLTGGQRNYLRSARSHLQSILLLSATLNVESSESWGFWSRILYPERFRRFAAESNAFNEAQFSELYTSFGDSHDPHDDERVIFLRRSDWPNVFPERVHHHIRVDSSPQEKKILDLFNEAVNHPNLNIASRAVAAQRAIRSLNSIRIRVNQDADFNQLSSVTDVSDIKQELMRCIPKITDSCVLALFDLLVQIDEKESGGNANSRVLIVTEDRPSLDAVHEFLKENLAGHPRLDNVEVLRNQNDILEALPRFRAETSDSNILVMTREIYIGLNLQLTRHIILFAIPMLDQQGHLALEHIEQIIGRVDRIGNKTLTDENTLGLLPIEVYTIARRHSLQDRTIQALEQLGFFTQSYASLNRVAIHLGAYIEDLLLQKRSWSSVLEEISLPNTVYSEPSDVQRGFDIYYEVMYEKPTGMTAFNQNIVLGNGQLITSDNPWWNKATPKEQALWAWLFDTHVHDHQAYNVRKIGANVSAAIRDCALLEDAEGFIKFGGEQWGRDQRGNRPDFHFDMNFPGHELKLYFQPFRQHLPVTNPLFMTPVHPDQVPEDAEFLDDEIMKERITPWRWLQFFHPGDHCFEKLIAHWTDYLQDLPTCVALTYGPNDPRLAQRAKQLYSLQIRYWDIGEGLSYSPLVRQSEHRADLLFLRQQCHPRLWSSWFAFSADSHTPIGTADSFLEPKPLHDGRPLPHPTMTNARAHIPEHFIQRADELSFLHNDYNPVSFASDLLQEKINRRIGSIRNEEEELRAEDAMLELIPNPNRPQISRRQAIQTRIGEIDARCEALENVLTHAPKSCSKVAKQMIVWIRN